MKLKFYSFFLIIFFHSWNLICQIVIDDTKTPEEIIQKITGNGVKISNLQLVCPNNAYGFFESPNTPVTEGVILSTGKAIGAIGPDNNPGFSFNHGTAGDNQLDVIAGYPTYDGCIMEFDIIPQCDILKLGYFFASEEYPLDLSKNFNDVFAFFVNGIDPNGGMYVDYNVALVPATLDPVSVFTVNHINNAGYFVDNTAGVTLQFDGHTTRLEAEIPVVSCESYHLKIAIADVTDGIFDSGIFLEGNSLNCSNVVYADNTNISNAQENCKNGFISLCRSDDLQNPLQVNYQILGDAINGTDYDLIDNFVIIPALSECTQININPIDDNTIESTEYVKIVFQPGPCNIFDTVTIEIADKFTITAGDDKTTCSGSPVIIGVNPKPGHAYSWNPAVNVSNPLLSNPLFTLTTGSSNIEQEILTLTVDSAGCIASDDIQITLYPLPNADFTVNDICLGNQANFNNQSFANNGILTDYQWMFGDGYISNTENPTHEYLFDGIYNVTLQVTDDFGCKHEKIIPINVWQLPIANFDVINACEGETTCFNDLSVNVAGDPIAGWLWNFDDAGANSMIQNPCHDYAGSGNKNVQLIVSSNKGCIGVTQKIVSIYPKPKAQFDTQNNCAGSSTLFENLSYVSFGTINNHTWYFDVYGTSNIENPSFNFPNTGLVTISLVTKTATGCKDSTSEVIEIFKNPTADFLVSTTKSCQNSCVEFYNNSFDSYGNLSYFWDLDNGNYSIDSTPVFCYENTGFYSVTLNVENIHGCKDTKTQYDVIEILDKPEAIFNASQQTDVFDPSVFIQNYSLGNIASYEWTMDDSVFIKNDNKNFYYFFDKPGDYQITLIVTNQDGCKDTMSYSVNIKNRYQAWIPNTFTPDKNGKNDVFYPQLYLGDQETYSMEIFTRWGERIYYTQKGIAWDGRNEETNELMKQDVYVYKISIIDEFGENIYFVGHVNLIR